MQLHVGDRIPADCRILALQTATLRVEQATLTGESVDVLKQEEPISDDDADIVAKHSIVFSGTAVTGGTCTAVVCSTGMKT